MRTIYVYLSSSVTITWDGIVLCWCLYVYQRSWLLFDKEHFIYFHIYRLRLFICCSAMFLKDVLQYSKRRFAIRRTVLAIHVPWKCMWSAVHSQSFPGTAMMSFLPKAVESESVPAKTVDTRWRFFRQNPTTLVFTSVLHVTNMVQLHAVQGCSVEVR